MGWISERTDIDVRWNWERRNIWWISARYGRGFCDEFRFKLAYK